VRQGCCSTARSSVGSFVWAALVVLSLCLITRLPSSAGANTSPPRLMPRPNHCAVSSLRASYPPWRSWEESLSLVRRKELVLHMEKHNERRLDCELEEQRAMLTGTSDPVDVLISTENLLLGAQKIGSATTMPDGSVQLVNGEPNDKGGLYLSDVPLDRNITFRFIASLQKLKVGGEGLALVLGDFGPVLADGWGALAVEYGALWGVDKLGLVLDLWQPSERLAVIGLYDHSLLNGPFETGIVDGGSTEFSDLLRDEGEHEFAFAYVAHSQAGEDGTVTAYMDGMLAAQMSVNLAERFGPTTNLLLGSATGPNGGAMNLTLVNGLWIDKPASDAVFGESNDSEAGYESNASASDPPRSASPDFYEQQVDQAIVSEENDPTPPPSRPANQNSQATAATNSSMSSDQVPSSSTGIPVGDSSVSNPPVNATASNDQSAEAAPTTDPQPNQNTFVSTGSHSVGPFSGVIEDETRETTEPHLLKGPDFVAEGTAQETEIGTPSGGESANQSSAAGESSTGAIGEFDVLISDKVLDALTNLPLRIAGAEKMSGVSLDNSPTQVDRFQYSRSSRWDPRIFAIDEVIDDIVLETFRGNDSSGAMPMIGDISAPIGCTCGFSADLLDLMKWMTQDVTDYDASQEVCQTVGVFAVMVTALGTLAVFAKAKNIGIRSAEAQLRKELPEVLARRGVFRAPLSELDILRQRSMCVAAIYPSEPESPLLTSIEVGNTCAEEIDAYSQLQCLHAAQAEETCSDDSPTSDLAIPAAFGVILATSTIGLGFSPIQRCNKPLIRGRFRSPVKAA